MAQVGSGLAGVAGMRDGSHLYHLFVAERFHGRGIGARLWEVAKREAQEAGADGFTVNASLYAVPIYQRFGFVPTGEQVVKDGLVSLPMMLASTAGDDPDGVDDAGDVAEEGQEDVEPEMLAEAYLEEDPEGR